MRSIKLFLTIIFFCGAFSAKAQIFPINATTQLVPPYSVYLPDYASGINNQLRVLLLNRDMTQPNYTVKLKMTIELNGSIIMRTADNFVAQPITLQPNEPYSVEGQQLAPYLNSNNIDFIGYSKQDYEQKKGLPEGAYRICFTAYDFRRPDNVKVSNEACSYYYLSKNDPPFINLPACGIFIAPLIAPQENLIEKAGRWLSYTLNIPWNEEEKSYWYDKVVIELTNMFKGDFSSEEAKSLLIEVGRNYALERNAEWNDTYGRAWKDLVYKEFTEDVIAYWSKDFIKYGAESRNTGNGTQVEIDMEPYINTGTGNNANINFIWTPRHISSPNSTLSTRYRIELFEVRPKSDNDQLSAMANMAVQSTMPVFTDVTPNTSYLYGPDKPALTDGMQYGWRVQAYDENGRDWFKNNGYSEVCYFTFGGIPETELPQMEQLTDFVATAEAERRGRMNWTQTGAYTSYKVRYRKKNGTGNWFDVNSDSLLARVYDLEPNTIYEAQVQGKSGPFYGPFSNLDTFKTPAPLPLPGCGVAINYAAGLSQLPLANASPYMIIKTGKFEFIVDSIGSAGGTGFYKGTGRITNVPFLAILAIVGQAAGNENASGLKVHFENVFINDNREVTQGDVYAVTRPLEEWLDGWDEYYEERRREEQQRHNRELFSDLDSNAVMLPVFDFEIRNVVFDTANHVITLTDINGNTHTYTLSPSQIGHDVIIQGANSEDQWVVRPDGTVVPVPGGGLSNIQPIVLNSEQKQYLIMALGKIKEQYNTDVLNTLKADADSKLNTAGNISGAPVQSAGTVNMDKFIQHEQTTVAASSLTSNELAIVNFKKAEYDYNFARMCRLFADKIKKDIDLGYLAASIKVEGKTYIDFITGNTATEAVKVDKVKTAILNEFLRLYETELKKFNF